MKTKTLKSTLAIILILLMSNLVNAQIKIGGGLSYLKFFGEGSYNNLGLGLSGEFGIKV